MILDTNLKLEAVLAAAVAANQPEYHVSFRDRNKQGTYAEPGLARGALNSGTDVTLLAAPGESNPRREIEAVSIYNRDTASVTVTVKTDDGTTERIVTRATLGTGQTLHFEKAQGWYILDSDGGGIQLVGQLATTSGTTKDFTIPSWAQEIVVLLNGVSWDGTEELIVQLGDAGGIEVADYVGTISTGAGTDVAFASGFLCVDAGAATLVVYGRVVISLLNPANFTWAASVSTSDTSVPETWQGAGVKSLSAALTTVRLTTTGTPDDFDAGAVNVSVR